MKFEVMALDNMQIVTGFDTREAANIFALALRNAKKSEFVVIDKTTGLIYNINEKDAERYYHELKQKQEGI